MVKVLNPLFSSNASGRFGNIVFQGGKFGTMVHVHTPQRFRPSTLQLQQNYYFGVAADSWRLLSNEEKQEYNNRATNLKMTGFNLYIKETIQHPT